MHGVTAGNTHAAKVDRDYRYHATRLGERCKRNIPAPLSRNDAWGVDMTGKGDVHGTVYPNFEETHYGNPYEPARG